VIAIDLAGQVAIVTGGARGVGRGISERLLEAGADVVICGRNEPESMPSAGGRSAVFVSADVRELESIDRVIAFARDRFGRLDVLVNNAGILHVAPIAEIKLEDYLRVIGVNQVGCLLGMKSVIPAMAQQAKGSIINISSTCGIEGAMGLVAYVSSKFAIRGMTKTAALELGRVGIRVNSICPGGVDTPMGKGDSEGFENIDSNAWYKGLPLQRIGQPEEVAKLALYLASDDSSYCTGSEFVIDGGMLAGERFA